jgi:hypothetical protein
MSATAEKLRPTGEATLADLLALPKRGAVTRLSTRAAEKETSAEACVAHPE